ncbi:MAG: hypothetical protein LBR75_00955, partial [Prevotellaceae bacterium]|nr:hypothetical protein [Prevotellaceae bacterium]
MISMVAINANAADYIVDAANALNIGATNASNNLLNTVYEIDVTVDEIGNVLGYTFEKAVSVTGVGDSITISVGTWYFEGTQIYTSEINNITITGSASGGIMNRSGLGTNPAISSQAQNLVLTNVNLVDNIGQGALTQSGAATLDIIGGRITGNSRNNENGGAIQNISSADMTIDGTWFESNQASGSRGGAIYT